MILSLYRPIVFANYSLGDGEVSRTAAVYSEDLLLFVVGNKVCLARFPADPAGIGRRKEGTESPHSSVPNPAAFVERSRFSLSQMFMVPSVGPGCAHFRTCSMCLMAPRFMNCGWCLGVCSRQHECTSQWNTDSCAPVITEVQLQRSPRVNRTGHNLISLTVPISPCAVFPQSCTGGRGDGGDAVRVGVPVSAAACHHQRQNSQYCSGIHRLCRPAREEQQ